MKISTRSYYGLRAMVFLASEKKLCSIKLIAKKEGLPRNYLEKIFQQLKKAKLVDSSKGADGGYLLALNAKKIKISNIIEALEGRIIYVPCGNASFCPKMGKCSSQNFWLKLEKAVNKSLNSVSLADLAKKK